MTYQIIIKGKKIALTPIAGTTVLRASAPLKCSICGEFRPFFYHIQIHQREPSMLVCAEECHEHLQKELMSHSEDHFLIRGIEAPLEDCSNVQSKFFIYCRAATPRVEHPSHSLDGQKESLTSYARKHGLVVSQVFQESGSAMGYRPLFTQMLQGIERGEADGILVMDVSRLARNAADGQCLIDMLDRGQIVQIATPALALNKSSLLFYLKMLEQQRSALSHCIKRGLQMRKMRSNLR